MRCFHAEKGKAMEVSFDVLDYLTPDEIREECKKAIRHSVHDTFARNEADVQRLISNLGYEYIFKAVSVAIGTDAKKAIAEKVAELAQDKQAINFEMWRKKDAWERTESPAISILYEAIRDNKMLMRECVQAAIREFDFPDVREAMYETACNIVYEKLFGGMVEDD